MNAKYLLKNFLFFNKIYIDLKETPIWGLFFMVFFSAVCTVLSFIDLTHFANPNKPLYIFSQWESISTFSKIGLICSIPAAISGVVSSLLIAFKKLSNFAWTFIFALTYAIFAFSQDLYGEGQMTLLVLFTFNIVGWISWTRDLNKGKQHDVVQMAPVSWKTWVFGLLAIAITFVIFFFEVPEMYKLLNPSKPYPFADNLFVHILDATIATLSSVGNVMFFIRKLGFAPIWSFNNVIRVLLYAGVFSSTLTNVNMSFMWFLFLINAILTVVNYHNIKNIFPKKNQIKVKQK